MGSAKDRLARLVTGAHKAVYRISAGRFGGRVAGMPVLILTTLGRHSGKARTTPLGYVEAEEGLLLVASNGGDPRSPQWYRNLCAHPDVRVTRGRSDEAMTARPATPEEKRRLWPRVVAEYPGYERYQQRTARDIPVVILSPADPETRPVSAPEQPEWS